MNAMLTHLRIRLGALLRDPLGLAMVLGTGVATFVMWPGPMPRSGPVIAFAGQPEPPVLATLFVFLWIWIWPALAGPRTGGRSSVIGLGSSMSVHPNPALPIGARARVASETALLLGAVLLVRAPALFLGGWIHGAFALPGPYPGDAAWAAGFAGSSAVGAAIMLPTAVAWVIPSRCPERMFARSGLMTAALMAAMWAGLLATPLSAVATGAALAAVQLALVGRERRGLRTPWRLGIGQGQLSRPPRPPRNQLVRDFVLRPLPLALGLLAAQASLMAAGTILFPGVHLAGEDGPGIVYMGGSLLLGVALGYLALRPMRSAQAVAGVFGRPGYRTGDFIGAWSILPVRRESVLRGVYLHGLLSTAAIWAAAVASAVVSSRLEHGPFDAAAFITGSPGTLLLPMAAVIPCMAGLLAAGAAGSKGKATLAAVALIAVFQGHFLLLMLRTPLPLHAAFLAAAAVLGGAPILPDLRRPSMRPDRP